MSLKAYEDACLRAELFGHAKPNKDEFLEKNKHLDEVEFNEDCQCTETADDSTRKASGFSDISAIFDTTQTGLDRIKGICGNFTSAIRTKLTSKADLSYSSDRTYVGQTNFDSDAPREPQTSAPQDVNSAIEDLKKMQQNEDSMR